MKRNASNSTLFSAPGLTLFVFIGLVLGFAFFLSFRWHDVGWNRHDGILADLTIGRVKQQRGGSHTTRIYVMRDHQYFLVQESTGFMGPSSNCVSFRGVLSQERYQQYQLALNSQTFQPSQQPNPGNLEPTAPTTWHIRVNIGGHRQCMILNAEDQSAPLVAWFKATENWSAAETRNAKPDQCTAWPDDAQERDESLCRKK